jgi:organic hydroperoxide reductase OsmC/OhrA
MVVIASRQTNVRPETIRTRLARFMPVRSAAGWSVAWAAHTERPDEIFEEDQARAADHIGCYGAAVAHALGQAGVAPQKLRIAVEADTDTRTDEQTITVEVRVVADDVDQAVIEAIARRAEPQCGVWKGLTIENTVRVIGIVEGDSKDSAAEGPAVAAKPAAPAPQKEPLTAKKGTTWRFSGPKWLSMRLALLTSIALASFAAVPMAFPLG